MALPSSVGVCAVVLLQLAAAFRHRSQKANASSQSSTAGERGQIHGVFSFGAPAMASPEFRNPLAANGCFPGLRAWNSDAMFIGSKADAVPMILGSLGYRHPMQEGCAMDVETGKGAIKKCSLVWSEGPWGLPDPLLHDGLKYLEMGTTATPARVQEVARIGLNHSYEKDPREAAALIKPLGWHLVGHALHPGTTGAGGLQVSLLMQHPETLKCILTFQGTAGVKDWLSNFMLGRSHFCGFVETDETCPETGKVCEVRNPGGAFVHEGFRNHFRRMVQHESWQSDIRPHLGSCAEVHAVGHSLGGVLSELLAGCTAKRLQEGDYGWNDAKWITWTQGTPKKLPYKYD